MDRRPIAQSSVWKWSYAYDTIKRGPMMCVSCAMDGNRQERKQIVVKCKASKKVKPNSALLKGSFWRVPMTNGITMTSPSQL